MSATPARRGARDLGWLLPPLVVTALVYWPILGNYFHADDFVNLFHIEVLPVGQYLTEEHGGHMLVVRNLVFLLARRLFGSDPRPYFGMVLVTHLVNVGLLFAVVRRLTGRAGLAAAVAALWGTAPVNERTLGWYAVYGQVLAATLLLLVLADLARVVRDRGTVSGPRAVGWSALLVAASACFGVGIGAAAAFPVAAFLLLPRGQRSRAATAVLLALPFAVVALYAIWNLVRVRAYDASPNTVLLLVGMLRYWQGIAAMLGHLVAAGMAELVLGGLTGASRYPGGVAYGVVAGIAVTAAVAAVRSGVHARRMAACLLLALGMYALIAAGRASLYAMRSKGPAAAGVVGRYHYAAVVPLAVLVALALDGIGVGLGRSRLVVPAVAIGLAAAALQRARTPIVFDHHDYARRETERALDSIRTEARAAPAGSDAWIRNREFAAVRYFFGGTFLGWASVSVIFFPDDVVEGRRVHFVEPNAKVLDAFHPERYPRLTGLIAPSAPAGATP
ncbi:MAG TPA: hypothetical protein VKA21_10720 [Candidatus Binatia bacterium]|nr:hypothetical protein [Candidatus Binatia bacterium]